MTRPEEQRSADRILSTVIARHALTNAVVSYVTSSFNTIYRVSADQGEFMLRVSPPQRIHEPDVTEAEEAWTDRVRGAGLAAPQLIRAFDGSTVLTEGRGEGGQAVLLTWLDGTDLQWPLTPGQIELLGELSAQLHRAVSPTATRTPGVLDASNPILFAVPDLLSTAPSAHRALFRRRFSEAQACLREVWSTANEMPRVLHFDLTPRNVLQLADGRLAVIDCQDLAWGIRRRTLRTRSMALREESWTRRSPRCSGLATSATRRGRIWTLDASVSCSLPEGSSWST